MHIKKVHKINHFSVFSLLSVISYIFKLLFDYDHIVHCDGPEEAAGSTSGTAEAAAPGTAEAAGSTPRTAEAAGSTPRTAEAAGSTSGTAEANSDLLAHLINRQKEGLIQSNLSERKAHLAPNQDITQVRQAVDEDFGSDSLTSSFHITQQAAKEIK
jgi:hypothetical protein